MRPVLTFAIVLAVVAPALGTPAQSGPVMPPFDDGIVEPPREAPAPGPDGVVTAWAPASQTRDTSDYMLGTVWAQVVFLESNGAVDPNTENWDASRRSYSVGEIQAGLSWWETQLPGGNPLDFRTVTLADTVTVATSYEPISRASVTGSKSSNQFTWLREAFTALGKPPGADTCPSSPSTDCGVLDAARLYAHELRNAKGTDWAFTIFVVDALVDANGRFADGYGAYAYRGGPFLVMPYAYMYAGVVAHETGHIFGATDEYASSPAGEQWGYLWGQETHQSGMIMDNAIGMAGVSAGTRVQIGWRDTAPANGRMDPLDTVPDGTAFAPPASPTNDATPTYTGTARDVPYPAHPNFVAYGFTSVSVNKVPSARWTVDGGAPTTTPTSPSDPAGAAFAFTTPPLADGTHTVSVTPVNAIGAVDATPFSHTITVDTVPPTVAVVHPAPGNLYVGPTSVPWSPAVWDPVVVGPLFSFEVSASAGGGTPIAKVEFYHDGVLFGTDTTPPYSGTFLTTNVGGKHTFMAKAFDAAGNTATATRYYDQMP